MEPFDWRRRCSDQNSICYSTVYWLYPQCRLSDHLHYEQCRAQSQKHTHTHTHYTTSERTCEPHDMREQMQLSSYGRKMRVLSIMMRGSKEIIREETT